MGRVRLTLPRLGETMQEAKVTAWLVAPGAAFRRGDVLLEAETDKTVVEVPALQDGVLLAQLVAAGETVSLDQPIAEVEAEVKPAAGTPAAALPETAAEPAAAAPVAAPVRPAGERPAASPAARAAARRAGVDLALVEGTGRRGRVTASDVAAVGAADGAGDTAVLLHGLFDDARGWRDLPRRLARAGLAVQAPDLPGHGAGAPAVPDLAAAEAALAAALPAGRLVLVGHSLGAALAVRLARALGPRVARLVLIAPAGIGARISADFVEGVLAAATPAALRRALALLDGGPMSETALQTELDRLAPLRAGLAALAGEVADGGFQQIDATADLARLTCDVAVVFGTADRVLDWRDVANLPARVAIHLVAGAGHLPHLAEPELIVRLAAGPSRARREAALG